MRELFGSGTLFGIEILPLASEGGWYVPNGLMLLAPQRVLHHRPDDLGHAHLEAGAGREARVPDPRRAPDGGRLMEGLHRPVRPAPSSSRTWRWPSSSACAPSWRCRRRSRPPSASALAVIVVQAITVPVNNLIYQLSAARRRARLGRAAGRRSDLPRPDHLHRRDRRHGADPRDGARPLLPGALQRAGHLPAADHRELRHPRRLAVHGRARLRLRPRAWSTASAAASAGRWPSSPWPAFARS